MTLLRVIALSALASCARPVGSAPATADRTPRSQRAESAACSRPLSRTTPAPQAPPFSGTSFLTPNLLTDADPSSLVSLTFTGQAPRDMFDRRTNRFSSVNAYLFVARFGTEVSVEVQVNPEFTRQQAEAEARFYATAAGRLPAFLFRDVRTMWIHAGHFPFGGGNENLLIHTAQGAEYARDGFLEEIMLHEATHTSLDAYHATAARWQEAQRADGVAVSTYARDNLAREDLAESLGPYLALRFWRSRLPDETARAIEQAMPSRITYLDCLGLSIDPVR